MTSITTEQAIADMGSTSIFIMDRVDVDNKRLSKNPLTLNLPNGNKVQSTHRCDIVIPGLLTILTGHIVLNLAITSLIGIRPLCKAEYKVIFDDMKGDIIYDENIIFLGFKDLLNATADCYML